VTIRAKSYRYSTSVRWTGEKKGALTAAGKPPVEVGTPPEFKGHEGIWSPEDLYVASVNVCILSTFLALPGARIAARTTSGRRASRIRGRSVRVHSHRAPADALRRRAGQGGDPPGAGGTLNREPIRTEVVLEPTFA
jgi:organic hydroperoxide reductase OsmC/OhrA